MEWFKPKREDGRSVRDVALSVLKDRSPETIVTYEELGKALELNPRNRADLGKIQMAVRDANSVLLKTYSRGVKNVPMTGYRILPAREHVVVANEHQNKATKALKRSLNFFEGANLSEMTDVERKLHQGQHMLAQALMASHEHLDRRINRIEALLKGGETINQK